jgi:hypothetical protein
MQAYYLVTGMGLNGNEAFRVHIGIEDSQGNIIIGQRQVGLVQIWENYITEP